LKRLRALRTKPSFRRLAFAERTEARFLSVGFQPVGDEFEHKPDDAQAEGFGQPDALGAQGENHEYRIEEKECAGCHHEFCEEIEGARHWTGSFIRLGIKSPNIGFFNIGFVDLIVLPQFWRQSGVWLDKRDYQVIGMCLEAARKKSGLTQIELAKRLRKPQSFVSAIEAGERRVDLAEFAAIALALENDPKRLGAAIFDALAKVGRKSATRF
jgi:hypothetical protein